MTGWRITGAVMQIEKILLSDRLPVSKYPENFAFQLFIILQLFTGKLLKQLQMRNFQCLLFLLKQSYICYYIICINVPLRWRTTTKKIAWPFNHAVKESSDKWKTFHFHCHETWKDEKILSIKFNNPLITWTHWVSWQMKYIISQFPRDIWPTNLTTL